MPNDSMSEPTIEQLSAYLDHELDSATQARLDEHLAGCADCQARLEGLRQTVHAVRALPMATPPRAFTIPQQPQRQRRWNWAPAGWIGGVAVATLIVIVGVTHMNFGTGPTAITAANKSVSGGLGAGQNFGAARPSGAVAPLARSDQAVNSARAAASSNGTTVVDPYDSYRALMVATDAPSYPSSGVIVIRVSTTGLTASEASSIRLWLQQNRGRGGYAIQLAPPANAPTFPAAYSAAYSIPQMSLPAPVTGSYTLVVQVQLSDGSSLIAELPLTITS